MVKYKCNDCGKKFKGDYSTKACPECKSENISEVTSLFANKTNRILFISIAAIIVAFLIVLFILLRPTTIKAELSEDDNVVTVTVSGIDVDDLHALYQVQVYTEEGESHDILFFENESSVCYNKYLLLPGRCYTFELEKIGGGKIENLDYPIDTRKVCIEGGAVGDTTVYPPQIISVSIGKPNRKAKIYNGVTVIIDKAGDYTYQVMTPDGKNIATQNSNVFNKLAPGDYVVKVTNGDGVESSKPFTLPDIVVEDLTLQKAQAVFDKLSKHQIKIGEARKTLATTDVKLAKSIGECNTLFDALTEADSFETEFKVVSFDVDDSGRIKSGTLVLKYK